MTENQYVDRIAELEWHIEHLELQAKMLRWPNDLAAILAEIKKFRDRRELLQANLEELRRK